jgi:pyrrolysyl-tRNA synthetase-like protein
MEVAFTVTQKQRLVELDATGELDESKFSSATERDLSFKRLSQELIQRNKRRLQRLHGITLRPAIREMESLLVRILNQAGFAEVTTPTILSKGMLTKMGITKKHALWEQVFWLESGNCLRPMLAPNLYHLMGYLGRLWPRPVRIFEIGQCFREESKGTKHLSEFTMLNLVEMGITGDPGTRLAELAELVMGGLGLTYRLVSEDSEVYGNTMDIMVDDLEIASGATGPHPLDANWNIAENWVGLGFGLERLVMMKEGFNNIRRVGRSLIYLDGARLNV